MTVRNTLALTATLLEEITASAPCSIAAKVVQGEDVLLLGQRLHRGDATVANEVLVPVTSAGNDISIDVSGTNIVFGGDVSIDAVRVVDHRVRMYVKTTSGVTQAFDRQVRAFGEAGQQILNNMRVGVIGAGGTGSAVCEQLIRLGIGHIVVVDDDNVSDDGSNVTRIYGSTLADIGMPKVEVVERSADHIGFGTSVTAVNGKITSEHVAGQLRHCDVIFGCTDDNSGRVLASRMAHIYLVPFIDMGVQIDSDEGVLRGINGRITTVMPGAACLRCRGRINERVLHAESLAPEERERLAEEDYAPELGEPDPAVVAYTTAVAALSVAELLNRMFVDAESASTEMLVLFHDRRLSANTRPATETCWCGRPDLLGAGDVTPLLGVMWTS